MRTSSAGLHGLCESTEQAKDSPVAEGLNVRIPLNIGQVRMIPAGVAPNRDRDSSLFTCRFRSGGLSLRLRGIVVQHGRVQVGIDPGVGTELCQQVDPDISVFADRPENLPDRKALPDQSASKLKRTAIHCLSDGKNSPGILPAEVLYRLHCLFFPLSVIKRSIEHPSQSSILGADPVDLIESAQLNKRNAQAFLQIIGCRPGLRVQDNVEVCLRHGLELAVIPTGSDLADLFDPCLSQKGKELTSPVSFLYRGKKSKDIHRSRLFPAGLQKLIDRLPHMYHGGLSSLPGKGIHIAGLYADVRHLFLSPPADTFHIRSQQGIHAGDADHHDAGPTSQFLQTPADFRDRPGDFFQVTSCHQIRLVHGKVKKAVLISRHPADGGGIPAAAAGRDDQHD